MKYEATSMTYGTLPTFEQFDSAFDAAELRDGRYHITLGAADSRACENFRLGDGEYTADQLYAACKEIVEAWNAEGTDAMDLVSGIIETLGFEWV